MKNNLMSVEKIEEILPHPNADKLEIAKVSGYEAIVQKSKYSPGDKIAFIHPDACIPLDQAWTADFANAVSSKTSRVKAKKIRGSWSFGLVVPFSALGVNANEYELGSEISSEFGVYKFLPPPIDDSSIKGPLPHFLTPTDEERYQTADLSKFSAFTNIWITEKIDGSSVTVYCVKTDDGYKIGYCSRNCEMKIPADGASNQYWEAIVNSGVMDALKKFCEQTDSQFAIRGELCGTGVQSSKNNIWSKLAKKEIRWFSLFDISYREYRSFGNLVDLIGILNNSFQCSARHVPILERFTLSDSENIGVAIKRKVDYYENLEFLEGRRFEGVVFTSGNLEGYKSFKVINKTYDGEKD